MLSKKFLVIFSLFMVLLCCFSAVSASEDVTDNLGVISDDVAVDEVVSVVDSDDGLIAASNDENVESVDDSGNESLAVQDEEQVNDVEEVNSTLTAEDDNGQTPVKHSYSNDLLSYAPGPNDFDPDAEDYRIMDIIIKIYDNCVYFSPQFVYEGGVWPSMFCWMDEDLLYGEYMESGLPDEYYDGNDNFYINISFFNTTLDKWQIVVEDSYHMPFPDYYEVFDEGSMTKTRFYLFNFTKGLYKVSYAYTGQTFEYQYYDYDNDKEIADTYTYLPSSGEYIIDLNKEFFIPKINNLESIVTYEGNDLNILPSISIIANGTIKGGYFSDEGFGDSFDLNVQSKSFDYKITLPNREIELIPWIEYDLNDFPQVKQVNITMTVTQGDNIIENFSVAPGDSYSLEGLAAGEYNLTAVYDDPYYGYATKTVSISIYGNHIWETEGADIGYSHKTDYSGPKNIQELWNLSVNNFQGPVIDFDGNIYIANGTNILVLDSNGKVINTYSMYNPSKGLLLWKDLLFTSRFSTFDDGAEWFRINDVMSDRNYEFIPTGAGNDATSRSDYAPVYSDGKIIYIIPEFGTNSYTRAHLLVYNADEPSGRTITYRGQTRPAYGTISKSSTFARETGAASVDSAGNIYVNTWDGLIIFNSNLVKYDLSFGDAGSYGRPVIDSVDNVYVFNSDRTKVYAINIDDEKTMLWNKTIAGGACGVMAVDVENNALYIVGNDGIVYSFNRANGEMSEFFNLGTNASSILVDGKGTLYIGGKNGILYAISNEGKKLFEYEIGGTINANIVLDNNETLYVHANGKLFALTRAPKLYSEIIINVSDGEVNRNNTIVAILPENATGNVTFIIDDTITSGDIPIINGNATWSAPGLKEGNHRVTVTWIGNDDYNGNTKTEEFNIYKVNSTIDLEDSINYVGKLTQLNITLPSDANGTVNVTFNRKTESVKIVNGIATFETTPLEAGNYTIDFSWDGDERYFGNSSYAYFTVIKNDATLTIDADPIREGEDLKVTVTVSDDESGVILISVGDINDFAQINDGKAEFIISGLAADTYDINATYLGDNKYNNATESSKVTVSPKDETSISINPEVIVNDDESSVEVTLPDDATGYVLVDVNGTVFYAEVNGGKVNVPVSGLKANTTYPVSVTYSGDDNYSSATKDGEITTPAEDIIEPKDPNLKLDIKDTVITVSIDSEATGKVIVTVGDISFVKDVQNLVPIDVGNYLDKGTYPVTVDYVGDEVFAEANVVGNVNVKANTVIFAPDVSVAYKEPGAELVVSIVNQQSKPLVVNLNVVFNGKEYSLRTDSNGRISIPIGNLTPGNYVAEILFKGSRSYKASNTTALVTVTKSGTVISASDVSLAYKDPAGELVAIITNEHGKPLVVNLNVNFNGKDYNVRTDSDGRMSLPVGNLAPGEYYATISYKEGKNYGASNTTALVTVTKSGTVISASDVSLAYKESTGELVAIITNEHGKPLVVNLNVNLNGKDYNVRTDSDGRMSLPIGTLASGNYVATISYKGSNNYEASSAIVQISVNKATTVIYAQDVSIAYRDPGAELSAVVISEHGKALVVDVTVNLNGKNYTVKTDSNGRLSIPIDTLSPGNYTATIIFKGSRNYAGFTTTVDVSVRKAATIISANDVSIDYRDPSGELVATIVNEHGKALVVGVTVNLNGKDYNVKTDSDGRMSLAIDTLAPGNYTATISYKGSNNYEASSSAVQVIVDKSGTMISAPDVSVASGDSNGALVASVTNQHGKPLVVSVNVKLDGKTTTVKTDSNGQISVATKDLKPGKYDATISYKGSGNYNGSTATAQVTVI